MVEALPFFLAPAERARCAAAWATESEGAVGSGMGVFGVLLPPENNDAALVNNPPLISHPPYHKLEAFIVLTPPINLGLLLKAQVFCPSISWIVIRSNKAKAELEACFLNLRN